MERFAWFWYFTIYSFLGFLLEAVFARVTRSRPDRKRTLLLPLCPVYGLGVCLCLFLSPFARGDSLGLFLLGAGGCTLVEYAAAVWYERGLRVSFWNYAGKTGNLHGRICLPFSVLWGVLFLFVFRVIQPSVEAFADGMPESASAAFAFAVAFDLAVSGVLLRRTGDRACLRWYDRFWGDSLPAVEPASRRQGTR